MPGSREVCDFVTEENFVFQLDADMKKKVAGWISESVQPNTIRNKVLADLEEHKFEISVSRPRSRLSWGISVPGDESQTIYVWLDALTNYLTVIGYPLTD